MNFKVHCQLYESDGKFFSYLMKLESFFFKQIQGMQAKTYPALAPVGVTVEDEFKSLLEHLINWLDIFQSMT